MAGWRDQHRLQTPPQLEAHSPFPVRRWVERRWGGEVTFAAFNYVNFHNQSGPDAGLLIYQRGEDPFHHPLKMLASIAPDWQSGSLQITAWRHERLVPPAIVGATVIAGYDVIDLERPFLSRYTAQLTPEPGRFQNLISQRAAYLAEISHPMLPDRPTPSLDVLSQLRIAERLQVSDLLTRESVKVGQQELRTDSAYHTMTRQHTSYHVLHDSHVVVDLTTVLVEESLGNQLNRGTSRRLQQRADHDRLVYVRHSHLSLDERAEFFVTQIGVLLDSGPTVCRISPSTIASRHGRTGVKWVIFAQQGLLVRSSTAGEPISSSTYVETGSLDIFATSLPACRCDTE
jgi:hypothetical protein